MRFIVGIDEVGRGPLAGPVSIGIVVAKSLIVMPELVDSKKMTEEARKRALALAREMQKAGELSFGVFSAAAKAIDTFGIEECLRRIIAKGLRALAPDSSRVEVVLDGRLYAPQGYRQQTIIHGDDLIPAISLAAVVAKLSRDAHMVRMGKKYPGYGFEEHKGYGTRKHQRALRALGPSPIHRLSYLGKLEVHRSE